MDIILTKEALAAAREWSTRSGAHLSEPVIVGLIEAALPHLAGRDGIDAEYWTEKLDVLTNAVDRLTDLVVDSRGEVERIRTAAPVDYPAYWGRERTQAEHHHRERMATIQAETEARVLAHAVSYPSDYEVWRDALLIAATAQSGPYASVDVVEDEARTYARTLRLLGEVRPEVRAAQEAGRAAGLEDRALDEATRCPDCQLLGDQHDPWCPKAERERSADQVSPDEDCPNAEEPDGAPDQPDAAADPALTDLADRVAEAVTLLNDYLSAYPSIAPAGLHRALEILTGGQQDTDTEPIADPAQAESEADR